MMNIGSTLRVVSPEGQSDGSDVDDQESHLDRVFAALSDPIRRNILQQLDGRALLVSELAAPFNISLQGVSRHIQVLVRAGLVQQERSGRISRCTLEAGPLMDAAVWLNQYAKYWQGQFDLLVATLADIDERLSAEAPHRPDAPQTPEPRHTPGASHTPERHTPEARQAPEAHQTPGASHTPEPRHTPEARQAPEASQAPEARQAPEPPRSQRQTALATPAPTGARTRAPARSRRPSRRK